MFPHIWSHLSHKTILWAWFLKPSSKEAKGLPQRCTARSDQTWTKPYIVLPGPGLFLSHQLPRKSGASVWDSRQQGRVLSHSSRVWGKEHEKAKCWDLGGDQVCLVPMEPEALERTYCLHVSHALTHCASSPQRLWLQSFRKAKMHSLLQRYRHLPAALSVSLIPPFTRIDWASALWQAFLKVWGTWCWMRQKSYLFSSSVGSGSPGVGECGHTPRCRACELPRDEMYLRWLLHDWTKEGPT